MIDFFSTDKYKVYKIQITPQGAGDSVKWIESGTIKAYVEPVNGEKLIGTETGKQAKITLILYTQNLINTGERIYIPASAKYDGGLFEIQQREFYKLPFFNYYKGYLVKTDENLSI